MTGIAAARFVHGIMLGCACGAFPGVRAVYKLAFPAARLSAFFGEPVPYRMPFAWYHVWLSPACVLHPTEKEGQMGLVVPLSSFYLEAMVIIFQVSLSPSIRSKKGCVSEFSVSRHQALLGACQKSFETSKQVHGICGKLG